MSRLLKHIRRMAGASPEQIALAGHETFVTYAELDLSVAESAHALNDQEIGRLGLLADNDISWALADLSTMAASVPLVPLPLFFTPQQVLHVITNAGLDAILTDRPDRLEAWLATSDLRCYRAGMCCGLHLLRLTGVVGQALPAGTAKITYTSGTTGSPKGVCLSIDQMETVALALRDASQATAADRHLCLTPLSTLLENIGGIYTPLIAGAVANLWPLEAVGLQGASGLNIDTMLDALNHCEASSAILAPQMLQALVAAGEQGWGMPTTLRFVAVGGAPVSPQLLQRAASLGLPVFEGYGLSECASVVALNTPIACQPGSVGHPLPHVGISFSSSGEILISGSGFLGYLGGDTPAEPWPTGDLGHLDADGYLHVTGRIKSLFITSFGRNVAPEWVERELTMHPAILQAAVFGEGRPYNVAVVVPRQGATEAAIQQALRESNRNLPDYARVTAWVTAGQPFSPLNQQTTTNGRLRREVIASAYADAINSLYQEQAHDLFRTVAA